MTEQGDPLEFATVTLRGMKREFSFKTLSGGEFYFENLADSAAGDGKSFEACGDPSPYRRTVVPGMYVATVVVDGSERHFNLHIAASDAVFVQLGEFRIPDTL